MRLSNNAVALISVTLLCLSTVVNLWASYKVDIYQNQISGKVSTGSAAICFNNAPIFLNHTCTNMTLYARLDGILRNDSYCNVSAYEPDNQTINYSSPDQFMSITHDGNITISGNISQGNQSMLENVTGRILIQDGTPCASGTLVIPVLFDDIRYNGGVILLQNYTSNSTDYIRLKEGFTTYHKSLDDYFKDIDDFPLTYTWEFFDLHCFLIDIVIDPVTHLVRYVPQMGSATDVSGPCHAQFTATNPFNMQNWTNIFLIYVDKSPVIPPDEGSDDQQSGGGGGGGGGGSGGGGGGSSSNPCRLFDVNCTPWSKCEYKAPEPNATQSLTRDGIQYRDCTWTTNCPDDIEPEREQVCDYQPSCNDSMMNCHELANNTLFCELGVDCGGPCPACPTCNDSVKNQGETGIDCGGPCPACPSCTDNTLNCHNTENGTICEEKIDCGGPCPACPTCNDSIRNCHIMDNGTMSCEIGIDCGGPCPKCVVQERTSPGSINWNLLLLLLLIAALIYPGQKLARKLKKMAERWYMMREKKKILAGRTIPADHYLELFEREIQILGSDFDTVTANDARQMGDYILSLEGTYGFAIDRYSVSFDNDYADILRDKEHFTINYAIDINNVALGRRLLGTLNRAGQRPKYRLCKRSSTMLWDDRWAGLPNMKYDKLGNRIVGRSVEYVISFMPDSLEQAMEVTRIIEDTADRSHVPDIRMTGREPIMDYEENVLNIREAGGQKLLVLTKGRHLQGFEHTSIYVNPELSKYIK